MWPLALKTLSTLRERLVMGLQLDDYLYMYGKGDEEATTVGLFEARELDTGYRGIVV